MQPLTYSEDFIGPRLPTSSPQGLGASPALVEEEKKKSFFDLEPEELGDFYQFVQASGNTKAAEQLKELYDFKIQRAETEGKGSTVDAYVDLVEKGDISNFENIPANIRNQVVERASQRGVGLKDKELELGAKSLVDSIEELKTLAREATVVNKFNPLSSKHAEFNTVKGLLGQTIAKMYEGGRLSDADRDFYQKQIVQIGPYGFDKPKEAILDRLKNEVLKKVGITEDELKPKSQGLGATPQTVEVKNKLKEAGYSDAEINEYLKERGL